MNSDSFASRILVERQVAATEQERIVLDVANHRWSEEAHSSITLCTFHLGVPFTQLVDVGLGVEGARFYYFCRRCHFSQQ